MATPTRHTPHRATNERTAPCPAPRERTGQVWALALATLAGCALLLACASPAPGVALYDLGPVIYAPRQAEDATAQSPEAAGHGRRLSVRVVAPAWLDSPGIVYRLAYADVYRAQSYAGSRWVAAPALLVAQRLQIALDPGPLPARETAGPARVLQVDLDEFSQVFTSPEHSTALLRARLSLMDSGAAANAGGSPDPSTFRVIAQRSVNLEVPAPTPDAAGAVQGLHAAVEALVGAASDLVQKTPLSGASSAPARGKS